jgi:hypothetical protein
LNAADEMPPMANHTERKRGVSPKGYIRIEHAIQVIRSLMFSQEIPEAVLLAAKKNVDDANASRTYKAKIKVKNPPTKAGMDLPSATLLTAIRSGDITLFAMTENSARIFPIAQNIVAGVLEGAGFVQPRTAITIALRLMDMKPMTVLQDLPAGELQRSAGKTFALILKENEFEDWLGRVARQEHWPVDKKSRRTRGRPDRVSAVKPLAKLLVESGEWRGGDSFKQITSLVNAKLKDQEAARGTIERALKQLYAETGDIRYRHKKRRRRASLKANRRP